MKGLSRANLLLPLSTPQRETIAHLSLKFLKIALPWFWNCAGFYVDRTNMPAQCLAEDIGHIPSVTGPRLGDAARLHGYRCTSPHVSNAGCRNLLGIRVEHR